MTRELDLKAFTLSLFIVGLVSYVLCIAGDLLLGWTMYQAWMLLLPGFTWPVTPAGFLIGLVWLVLYSFYLAVLIVWPYNLLVGREPA
jgi:hypothetical protein